MKKNILFITALLISLSFYCQNFHIGDTIYYKYKVISTQKKADYFTIINSKKIIGNEITNSLTGYKYSKDSLKFFLDANYFSNKLKTISPKGLTTYFHENGNKKSQGHFAKKNRAGKWIFWNKENNKQEERLYRPSVTFEPYNLINFWNKEGKHIINNGNGYYDYQKDSVLQKGNYKNGKKIGEWIGFKNSLKYFEEDYSQEGLLIFGKSWDKEGKEYTYKNIENHPKYPKGSKGLLKYISKISNLQKNKKINSKTIIQFEVMKDGSLQNIKILKSLCESCDEKTIKIIKKMEKWTPGKIRGQKVNVKFTLPISFSQSSKTIYR